ncbi:glycosyltransferase [Micromonospora sp. HUAS LYJ1]|uniref:glycosyltransferase n=1 Tax=Micromonospora sp. HUAS LYJ1 TaxID=3061626 RepID=UPI002672857E|nr:glycosyltransferase [Micromonospora sp. HUAS LYJ1]WKU08265.1 glycosyltransferase [Micromonospora sp. HUAS LYJ1]
MSESDHALAEILEWFSDLEAAIPGVRSTVGEILIGKIPESDIDAVYELSDAWGAAAQELAACYEEALHAADGILTNWSGDGAAEVFTREWLSYLESLAGTVDTLASMEEAVQSFGLQIELMKFMALLGLIMLAVSLFMLVAAAIPSLGLSTAGIPGAFAACRAAIGAAATNAVRAIGSISVRAALAEVTALLTRTLPTLVRTQLPTLVRTQVPRLVTTQLPRFARTQIPTLVRQTLPTVIRQGAGNLARNTLPRNVIARSVADRMAGQWLRGVTNRELLRQLGREAGLESRRLAGRSLLAARNQLAREIEEQLLRRFGARVGTDLAARGGVRLAGTEAFEQLSRATLSQYATREIATTTFGRELTKYLGQRVAFGAAFMGGGNLLGQMYQIAGGERAGLDLGQLGVSTVQGGLFGASMFGGIPGHVIGGGVTGALVTGATDAAQGRFDLQNMLHGGAEGAKAGVIFGAQNKLETVRVGGMNLRIGRDVMVLPEGMAAVDRAAGLRVTYSERGAVWAHVDGDGQRLDGGAIAADGTVLARDGVRSPDPTVVDGDGPTPGGPGGPHPPRPELPPADLPQRTDLAAGGTGGGDGGGPRQPAHPAPVRTPEAGTRLADPARPSLDPPRPPADPVRPGGERTPGEWSRPGGDRAVGESTPPPGERTAGDPVTRPTPADTAPPRGPVDGAPTRPDGPPPGRDADPVRADADPGRRDPDDAPPPLPADRPEPQVTTRDDAAASGVDRTGPATDPTGVTRADPRPDHPRPEARPATDRPPHDRPPEDRGAENRGPGDRDAQSGASIRPRDELRAMEWADRAYDRFRADPGDVADIAANLATVARPGGTTGFTHAEIARVKQHLMVDEHVLRDYPDGWVRRRFDADEDIAEAWIRLREGRPLEPDLVLLEHELAESGYLLLHPDATYPDAHAYAQSLFNWERVAPGRTGEDLDNSWPRRTGDGDSGGLRNGPGGQSGGRVQLRPPGEGPSAGHPEGVPGGAGAGRAGGHAVQEGVRQDPADAGRGGELAAGGQLRGVAQGHLPAELVPAGSHPVGPAVPLPEAVRSTFDGHVGELLAGRDAGPVDQPHRASWDESSRLLTVEYPDGLRVGVVLQVNAALPPGQPVVLRPGMAVEHGQWVQREPAGVVLPEHLPADPAARAAFVDRQLGDAWRTLHREIHQVLDRPVGPGRAGVPADGVPEGGRAGATPADGPARSGPARRPPEPSLAALEAPARPDPPVLDADAVGFRDATAPAPAPPRPLTPDTVRGLLADDPATPGQLRDWAREHLAVRLEDGSYLPRSQAEIDAVVARLRAETTALVAQRTPADPNAAAPAPAPRPAPADTAAPRTVDPDAAAPRVVDVPSDGPPRAGDELPISQELAPSGNFPAHRTRTGAELPEQVHELVGRAKENLLARYPEAAVAGRLADLDAVAGQADRLQAAADRARDGGPLGDVVREVRALSRAVDGYADRYRDWRDFSRGGEHADPGWRDLDGVDPLNSVEMAHRVVSVDPVTHRFHVIDQAIAVAKIGDVLGPAFERHAADTFDRVIPKDPDSARALVPAEAYTPALEQWIAQGARGGFDSRHGLTFIAAGDGGQPRPIGALAATVLHEGMHRLQPNPDHIGSHLLEAVADGRLPRGARDDVLVNLRFEGEFQAFTVQQQFLRGLAGFRSADHASDPRLPRSDGYRSLADLTPRQLQEYVTSRYVAPTSRSALSPDMLRRLAELPPESFVERARQAIEEATHPLAEQRRQGTLYGPMSRDVAERFGLDLDALGGEQAARVEPPLRDRGGPAPTVHPDPATPPPLAEWGPGGPTDSAGFHPSDPPPERPRGGLRRIVDRVAGVFRSTEESPPAPEGQGRPRGDDPQRAPAGWSEPVDRQPPGEPRPWASDDSRSYRETTGEAGPARGGLRPTGPAVDAATLLRAEERRYALEELRAATDPIDQARLRAELDRVDADLARRGYPVHQLEPVPEAPQPQDALYVDGRDHSRHDELWTDRRWRQEDRRPSLDELLPSSDEEVAAWSDAVRAEVAAQLDGREFAGLRLRLDLADEYSVSVHRDQVIVRADIVDPERGSVGRVVRVFQRDHDGTLFVEHTSLRLAESVQGRGFAREWNAYLEDWYRESGVQRIEVHAASTVGGYAWARDGYDWAPDTGHRADAVLDRLRAELREVDADIALADRATDGPVDPDRLRARYGTTDPQRVLAEAYRQREAGREILDRAARHPFGSSRYPTPFEISQAGWGEHHQGRDAAWIGKRALLGADWKGVKPVSDTGPLHPRSAYPVGLPRVPDPSAIHGLLSGGHPPVTAARVPDAQFHGYGRDTPESELVRQLGDDALRQTLGRLPADSPLRGVRLELTVVPADALPDGAVARSVPVDADGRDLPHGTVPTDRGGWRIELSDRAADVTVARAVAHEAAELTAIGERAAGGLDPFTLDALTPGALADGAGLSPHDLGRLAEAEVLADLLRDPAQATYARTELRALRDHLGLHPDDPGLAARLRLLDGRLSDAGREALVGADPPARTPTLRMLGFAEGVTPGGTVHRVAEALGGRGDELRIRVPGAQPSTPAPGVRVFGADPVAGVTGPLSPLLRPDGLPGDVDVLVGHGQTAGIADVRRDAYPDAAVVQLLDRVPTDPEHLRVLSRADLVVAVGPDVADGLRQGLTGLGGRMPEIREVTPGFVPRPVPPPGDGPGSGPRLLVYDGDSAAHRQAARVVAELRSRGLDGTRLVVTGVESDPGVRQVLSRELSTLAGTFVEVRPLPTEAGAVTATFHAADVVLVSSRGDGYDPGFVLAAEHGVPVLVDGATGAGRLLTDPDRVPTGLGRDSVVGEPVSAPTVWADRVQGLTEAAVAGRERALELRRHLTGRFGPEATAQVVHDGLAAAGVRGGRVADGDWNGELSPYEVVRRNPAPAGETAGRLRVMTTCTEWHSKLGGVPTANRELTEAFAAAGAQVHARVSAVDPDRPDLVRERVADNLEVTGVRQVWGVLDAKGLPDTRALLMLFENLPPEVDVVVGHSRFSGGAARLLVEQLYPGARYVHVLHTAPEVLDGLRGNPGEGLGHAETERRLMAGADLVTGVGPLLGQEAARLAGEGVAHPPRTHEIISDMPRLPGEPVARPADKAGFDLVVQGRATDPIKGIDFAAKLVRHLRAEGVDVRLTVRGAPPADVAAQTERLAHLAGTAIRVLPFVKPGSPELTTDLYTADLVLMPSIHEGFGLVASEAARAGVPVLVGEGTGAGLFFGDPRYVPAALGEAATVRDGVTVAAWRRGLAEITRPDGTVDPADQRTLLDRVADERVPVWAEHVKRLLSELAVHRDRALDLRRHLDAGYPPGNAARKLLAVLAQQPDAASRPDGVSRPDASFRPDAVQGGREHDGGTGAATPDRPSPDVDRPGAGG